MKKPSKEGRGSKPDTAKPQFKMHCQGCGGYDGTGRGLCPSCAQKRIAYLEKCAEARDAAAWEFESGMQGCRYCECSEEEGCSPDCPREAYPLKGG